MKNFLLAIISFFLLFTSISFADEFSDQAKVTLKALQKVNSSTSLSYAQFMEALSDSETEVDILNRIWGGDFKNGYQSGCYTATVSCFYDYKFAGSSWKSEIESRKEADTYRSVKFLDFARDDMLKKYDFWKKGDEKLDKAYKVCVPPNKNK
ncbi:MAG: hypothetical protein WCG82_10210 [Bacteroidota bacterium]